MSTSNYKINVTLPGLLQPKGLQRSPGIFEITVRLWSGYSAEKFTEKEEKQWFKNPLVFKRQDFLCCDSI